MPSEAAESRCLSRGPGFTSAKHDTSAACPAVARKDPPASTIFCPAAEGHSRPRLVGVIPISAGRV